MSNRFERKEDMREGQDKVWDREENWLETMFVAIWRNVLEMGVATRVKD